MASMSGALPSMRNMYRAGDGNILIEGDYAQQELRVMFAVSGDVILGRALDSGDVYTEDAKAVFNLPPTARRCKCDGACVDPTNHVKGAARQACKVTHLTGQYGGGLNRVYEVFLEIDRQVKFEFVARVFDGMWNKNTGAYKGTVAYWDRELARVAKLGYSESRILGRRLYYPRMPERSRAANYPIQSTAADMTSLAEIYLDDHHQRIGDKWMGQIQNQHDALMVECKNDPSVIRDVVALMREAMGQEFEIEGKKYHFPVDFKAGEVWGLMHDYHE